MSCSKVDLFYAKTYPLFLSGNKITLYEEEIWINTLDNNLGDRVFRIMFSENNVIILDNDIEIARLRSSKYQYYFISRDTIEDGEKIENDTLVIVIDDKKLYYPLFNIAKSREYKLFKSSEIERRYYGILLLSDHSDGRASEDTLVENLCYEISDNSSFYCNECKDGYYMAYVNGKISYFCGIDRCGTLNHHACYLNEKNLQCYQQGVSLESDGFCY